MLYIQIEQTLSNNDGSETIATRCSLLSENANKEQKHKKLRSQGKCGRDCPSLVGGRPAKSVVERPRGFKSHIPRFYFCNSFSVALCFTWFLLFCVFSVLGFGFVVKFFDY